MKNTILTLASILFINLNIMASETKTIRIVDHLGKIFNIEIKVELVESETFQFDTKEVFNNNNVKNDDLIDIRPFIKPEKEVEEDLPF